MPSYSTMLSLSLKFSTSFVHHSGTSTLQHLQATLEGQPLYVELLQEVSPGHSPGAQTVLATFETSAVEFLFPYPQLRPTYTSGVDVDLLMEPTRDFPGIISPKVCASELLMVLLLCFDFEKKKENWSKSFDRFKIKVSRHSNYFIVPNRSPGHSYYFSMIFLPGHPY